jgi:2-succinyl-5-enolpyruvyl-6-hydroxy-3-cyclohexene-1-carboxylate synthase
MLTDKKSVLELVALLKAHGVKQVVLCPGSRNIPIVHTLSLLADDFVCHGMTDERSAGFYAIGLALSTASPVAVCCTSGSALLNLHSAVAEAFYQQVPLVVISADRPASFIGQMEGQTLPQPGVFGSLVKMSVNLPEVSTDEDERYANRLINEALLATHHRGKGPVHINVPLSEPLFCFTTPALPEVRVINRYEGLNVYDRDYNGLISRLNKYRKRMIVVGQMNLIYEFEKRGAKMLYKNFAWLSEYLSNRTTPGLSIRNFDVAIATMDDATRADMAPDIVITYGGHVISKRLRKFLRDNPPREHWHVSADGCVPDIFGRLTTVIEMDPFEFLEKIAGLLEMPPGQSYQMKWENYCKALPVPEFAYSEMSAVGSLMGSLPAQCALHLANSSPVRYAELFPLADSVEVCCNRGVNGIDGSLSTALGYAACSEKLNFIVTGDLSFFYDMNSLWTTSPRPNVRILLLNNGGGEIFHTLPGLEMSGTSHKYITGVHGASAREWCESRGLTYLRADDEATLAEAMAQLVAPEAAAPILLEVMTNKNRDARILKEFYNNLKNKRNEH